MYDIELESGEVVPVWRSTVLDSQMNGVKYGDRIKITYLGEVPSPKRPGKKYRNCQVEIWFDE